MAWIDVLAEERDWFDMAANPFVLGESAEPHAFLLSCGVAYDTDAPCIDMHEALAKPLRTEGFAAGTRHGGRIKRLRRGRRGPLRLDDAGMRVVDDALGRHHHELDGAAGSRDGAERLEPVPQLSFPRLVDGVGTCAIRLLSERREFPDEPALIYMVMFLGRDALPEKMIYSEGTHLDMTAGRPGRGHASP